QGLLNLHHKLISLCEVFLFREGRRDRRRHHLPSLGLFTLLEIFAVSARTLATHAREVWVDMKMVDEFVS
ncbi:MAG: hypothetical protein ABJB34_09780, partial [Acidobacteriota bacterium]